MKKTNRPFRMQKGKTIYERSKYGSYINIEEYGIVQQKNAMSLKELISANFKPI